MAQPKATGKNHQILKIIRSGKKITQCLFYMLTCLLVKSSGLLVISSCLLLILSR